MKLKRDNCETKIQLNLPISHIYPLKYCWTYNERQKNVKMDVNLGGRNLNLTQISRDMPLFVRCETKYSCTLISCTLISYYHYVILIKCNTVKMQLSLQFWKQKLIKSSNLSPKLFLTSLYQINSKRKYDNPFKKNNARKSHIFKIKSMNTCLTMIFVLKCLLYQFVLTSAIYIVNYELFQAADYI